MKKILFYLLTFLASAFVVHAQIKPNVWAEHTGGNNYKICAEFNLPSDSIIFSSVSISGWGVNRGTAASFYLSGEGNGIKSFGPMKEKGKRSWQKRSVPGTEQKMVVAKRRKGSKKIKDTTWKQVRITEKFESQELRGKVTFIQPFEVKKQRWTTKENGKRKRHIWKPDRATGTFTYEIASLRPDKTVASVETGTRVTVPFDVPLVKGKKNGKKKEKESVTKS